MSGYEVDTKKKIINTVIEFLNEMDDPDKITIRKIAERAGVGIGLINYHFKTRETLLNEAVSTIMQNTATRLNSFDKGKFEDPVQELRQTLKELSDIAMQNSKFLKISASYELLQGNIETPLYYVPLLREIFKDEKDEIELRIIAMQLNSIMQIVFLRPAAFQIYTGIDINNKSQRDKLIDTFVNNLIK